MTTITVPRAVLEQALAALEEFGTHYEHCPRYPTWARPELQPICNCGLDSNVAALRAALAKQEAIAQNLQSRLDAALLLEERRQEIAQPRRETEQEPTVRIKCTVVDNQHPSGVPFEQWVNAPRREWRNLTMQEINALPEVGGRMWNMGVADAVLRAIRAVEAKLKEKNS